MCKSKAINYFHFFTEHGGNYFLRVTMALSIPGRRLLGDEEAFETIKETNRSRYKKVWNEFKAFLGEIDFDQSVPSEDDVLCWIKKMRTEDKFKSSSLWTKYSMVNSTMKAKYGFSMKDYHRVTNLLKSYDVDMKTKAAVFSKVIFFTKN